MNNADDPRMPKFIQHTPDGDDRERRVCATCGFVDYVNPRIVVGTVATAEDGRILLCRRAIEPRRGYWTLPAGFLEEGESVEDGARREALEEANAHLKIQGVLAIYSIPRISQVQIMFRATLAQPDFSPGAESLETALFAYADIPWAELAFPSVAWSLRHWRAAQDGALGPFSNPESA